MKVRSCKKSECNSLPAGVYVILEPAHLENTELDALSRKVEKTGKNRFFTMKSHTNIWYTGVIFQTRFGPGTFDTIVDGINVGSADSDYGTICAVPLSFIIAECGDYTRWFVAWGKGTFCTFFKTEEPEMVECVNGVLRVGDFLTLDTGVGKYERDPNTYLKDGQRLERIVTCYLTMRTKYENPVVEGSEESEESQE